MIHEGRRTLRQRLLFNVAVLVCALPFSFLLAAAAASGAMRVTKDLAQADSAPLGRESKKNRGVERGEFTSAGGELSKITVTALTGILSPAASSQQYAIDIKRFKYEFLHSTDKVRLLLVPDSSKSYSHFLTSRTIEYCSKGLLICAILDPRLQDGDPASMISSQIPVFDLVDLRLDRLSALLGITDQNPSGLYVFDVDGRLIWFGAEKSKIELAPVVAEVVVRTLLAVKRPSSDTTTLVAGKEDSKVTSTTDSTGEKKDQKIEAKAPSSTDIPKMNLHRLNARLVAVKDNEPSTLRSSWAIKTAKKEGKAVVLMFWATWCHPCVAEIPDLAGLNQEYGRRVVFIGLAQEINKKEIRDLILKLIGDRNLKIQYIAEDGAALVRKVFEKSGEDDVPLPAFAVFDKQGELVDRILGSIKDEKTLARLRTAIEKAQSSGAQKTLKDKK